MGIVVGQDPEVGTDPGFRLLQFPSVEPMVAIGSVDFPHSSLEVADCPPRHVHMSGLNHKPQKLHALLHPLEVGFSIVQPQAEILQQKCFDLPSAFLEVFLVVVHQEEIIHISPVPSDLQIMLHIVVKVRHVEVGEDLAGQVPDGCPFPFGVLKRLFSSGSPSQLERGAAKTQSSVGSWITPRQDSFYLSRDLPPLSSRPLRSPPRLGGTDSGILLDRLQAFICLPMESISTQTSV